MNKTKKEKIQYFQLLHSMIMSVLQEYRYKEELKEIFGVISAPSLLSYEENLDILISIRKKHIDLFFHEVEKIVMGYYDDQKS